MNMLPKVCHVVLGLPSGGTEHLVYQMIQNPPRGFSASAICFDDLGILGQDGVSRGMEIVCLGRKAGLDWTLAARIAGHARRRNVRILHCHQYTPWFYGILSKLLKPELKVVFTEHGRFYPDVVSWKRRCFNKVMGPLTDCITGVSPATLKALREVEGFNASRMLLIYNGVDGSNFEVPDSRTELRSKLGLSPARHYFILTCRLDPIKWIDGLLQAFRLVVDRSPETGLLLIGDGHLRESIASQIRQLGLQDHVVMPGYQPNVAEWLKAADVFVMSSLSEGTSVSLIESMAAGLPCVVTRVGGNEHVMQDGVTGVLVPPRSVEALAEGMHRMIVDWDMRARFGQNALKRFKEHFQLTAMLQGYEGIYRSLLNPDS